MIALYYQTKIPISFWCRRELNPRSFIQPSEILPVELIETYYNIDSLMHLIQAQVYDLGLLSSYYG